MELFQKIKDFYKYYLKPRWVIVWYLKGEWNIIGPYGRDSKYCNYAIYYSKTRKKYKLVCGGYHPKEHARYQNAIDKIIEINKRGICI